jgi:uncharacterized protein (DUF1778 family)
VIRDRFLVFLKIGGKGGAEFRFPKFGKAKKVVVQIVFGCDIGIWSHACEGKVGRLMKKEANVKNVRTVIRTTPSVKRVLQEAAAAKNKTVTEFVLDAALIEAAEVIAERRLFLLDDEQWEAFTKALDAPTKPMPRLEALFREPSVLE